MIEYYQPPNYDELSSNVTARFGISNFQHSDNYDNVNYNNINVGNFGDDDFINNNNCDNRGTL